MKIKNMVRAMSTARVLGRSVYYKTSYMICVKMVNWVDRYRRRRGSFLNSKRRSNDAGTIKRKL